MKISEILKWLRAKLHDEEMGLKTRKRMQKTWLEGTDETWRAVGFRLDKAARREESERQGRISIKVEYRVKMFKETIAALKKIKP
jgi:hypothetical protein